MSVKVRRAELADLAILVEFNRCMAWETEGKRLEIDVLTRGVASVIADEAKGFYLIGERQGDPIGQLMVTREWSDWRNGDFWWIQSVYVREDARRSGVFTALYEEIERLAKLSANVIGIRLYVERDNRNAQRTYSKLGMVEAPYLIYQKWPLTMK